MNSMLKPLAKSLRSEDTRVDLDEAVFQVPGGLSIAVSFPAAVSMRDHKLRFHLRVPASAVLPPELRAFLEPRQDRSDAFTPNDCYRVSARTEHGLAVELEGVHPQPSWSSLTATVRRFTVTFERLHIPAEDTDAMDSAELRRFWQEFQQRHNKTPAEPDKTPPPPARDQFSAILPDVKLIIRPHGSENTRTHPFHGDRSSSKLDCFVGEIDGGSFCLESTEDGDLKVSFSRPITSPGSGYASAKIFDGILEAIGYTHGCHPWPFYCEHRQDHRVVERWIKPRRKLQRDGLTPLPQGTMLISKDAQDLFVATALFFATDSEISRRHQRAQWLLREASLDTLAFELRLMALCVLYEGLMRDLESRFLADAERAPKDKGGLVRSEKWRQAIERSGLPWKDAFERVHESWDFYRSPLAHGFQKRTNEPAGTVFKAYSRLTAAIHILLAREAGYAGRIAKSRFEGEETVRLPTLSSEKLAVPTHVEERFP